MTPTTLAPPPPSSVEETAPAASRPGSPPNIPILPVRPPLRRARQPDPTGRITRTALAASLLLHLLLALVLVLAPPAEPRVDGVESAPGPSTGGRPGGGGEQVSYLDIGAFPSAEATAAPAPATAATEEVAPPVAETVDSAVSRVPEQPRFPTRVPSGVRPVPTAPQPGAPGGVPGGVPGGAPAGGNPGAGAPGAESGAGGAAGRVGPEYRDPRLIVERQAVPERELTDIERYRAHLARRLEQYNDSVADEAAHQRRIRNWTVKDKNGREWGLSENGPVIAGRRVPIPVPQVAPRASPELEEETRDQRRQHAEINRQAEDVDRDRYLRERARAMRARQDSIRNARKGNP